MTAIVKAKEVFVEVCRASSQQQAHFETRDRKHPDRAKHQYFNFVQTEIQRNTGKEIRKQRMGKSTPVFNEPDDPSAKMGFLKERIGVEVAFGHASFMGIDLLKFQLASYSGLDKIDVGVYVVTTHDFQAKMKQQYRQNWKGSLNFEKVVKYLPHFKSAIQLPIYVLGIDL